MSHAGMTGKELIAALKGKLAVETDQELAQALGLTVAAVRRHRARTAWTARQVAGLVARAAKAGAERVRKAAVRPLVEFFKLDLAVSRFGANHEMFDARDEAGEEHCYKAGLRDELETQHGVYLFYDSRGQAIYAGKARRQSLWKEMNLALNRDRGKLQKIKRVRHPERRVEYRTSDERVRQIVERQVPLSEIAVYFSAYQVEDELIEDVEALLVRSFANGLLNKRAEKFTRHRVGRA